MTMMMMMMITMRFDADSAESLSTFRQRLKAHFFAKSFY